MRLSFDSCVPCFPLFFSLYLCGCPEFPEDLLRTRDASQEAILDPAVSNDACLDNFAPRDSTCNPSKEVLCADLKTEMLPTQDVRNDSTSACPAVCSGGCQGGACHIDCSSIGSCPAVIHCPPSMPCEIFCSGKKSCQSELHCSKATDCSIHCTGESSCQQKIWGGSGTCAVECLGEASCDKGVDCSHAQNSTVRCGVLGVKSKACVNGPIVCGKGSCSIVCEGVLGCKGGVDCRASCGCSVQCEDSSTCQGGVFCPLKCGDACGPKDACACP